MHEVERLASVAETRTKPPACAALVTFVRWLHGMPIELSSAGHIVSSGRYIEAYTDVSPWSHHGSNCSQFNSGLPPVVVRASLTIHEA